ncbi:MAG: putative toxin-antitoxin system toxin component, PIN family [Longimicrobiaceae bacterium]
MRVVLDTNVVVSALLSPHGAPAQVLRFAVRRELIPLDERIVAEYREVLARRKVAFDSTSVAEAVEPLERAGELVTAQPLAVELPDPSDLPFLEVAVAGEADALVMGNDRHYLARRGEVAVAIMSPRRLVTSLGR